MKIERTFQDLYLVHDNGNKESVADLLVIPCIVCDCEYCTTSSSRHVKNKCVVYKVCAYSHSSIRVGIYSYDVVVGYILHGKGTTKEMYEM